MASKLKYESLTASTPSTDQLHLTRFYQDKNNLGSPVLMLHSALHDGNTFFDANGSGLACYLARQGYDVYVADLRGKGKSWPRIGSVSKFGLHQLITEDIPCLVKKIVSKRGPIPQIWVSHGWGGVLLCAAYARYGDSLVSVERMVHFGTRRMSLVSNFKKWFVIDVLWKRLSKMMVLVQGYMPVKFLRLGTSNESARSYRDYLEWSGRSDWSDTEDGFDYGQAILQRQLPPSYYFAAKGDMAYGHPDDVRQFVKELGPHDGRLMVLGRSDGNLQDYDHLEMLSHKDCEQDHFPVLLNWLQEPKIPL
jgi:predicted alpha/beta hydrolase